MLNAQLLSSGFVRYPSERKLSGSSVVSNRELREDCEVIAVKLARVRYSATS